MDRGRLIVAGVALAVIGCRGAAAAPPSPSPSGSAAASPSPSAQELRAAIAVPAAWVDLPRVAAAAKAAADPDAKAAAWGEPSAGCYLVLVSARSGGEADDAKKAMITGLGLSGADADGHLAQDGLQGRVKGWTAATGDDVVSTAAACVYNEREPAACAAACDAVWSKLVAPPVIP